MLGESIEAGAREYPRGTPQREVDRLVALGETYVEFACKHGLACLLLDGPLAMKMPDTAREAQIAGVLGATRALLQASLAQTPAAKSGKRAKPKRARG